MSDFRKWLLCRNRCCLRKFLEDLVLTGSKECNLRMSGALLKFKKPEIFFMWSVWQMQVQTVVLLHSHCLYSGVFSNKINSHKINSHEINFHEIITQYTLSVVGTNNRADPKVCKKLLS